MQQGTRNHYSDLITFIDKKINDRQIGESDWYVSL